MNVAHKLFLAVCCYLFFPLIIFAQEPLGGASGALRAVEEGNPKGGPSSEPVTKIKAEDYLDVGPFEPPKYPPLEDQRLFPPPIPPQLPPLLPPPLPPASPESGENTPPPSPPEGPKGPENILPPGAGPLPTPEEIAGSKSGGSGNGGTPPSSPPNSNPPANNPPPNNPPPKNPPPPTGETSTPPNNPPLQPPPYPPLDIKLTPPTENEDGTALFNQKPVPPPFPPKDPNAPPSPDASSLPGFTGSRTNTNNPPPAPKTPLGDETPLPQ